jgi:hypothetical protein
MSFLLFGSAWFWILLVIAVVLVTIATEHGSGVGATATLIITVALLFFFGNQVPFKDFFVYVIKNPWITLFVIASYIILGVCWSILKWYFFLIKERDRCIEEQLQFPSVPSVGAHKSEIMIWMFYWPFSAVWTVLDHPVKRIFLFIYNRIKARMQEMANKIFEPLTQQQRQREAERNAEIERRRERRSNGARE